MPQVLIMKAFQTHSEKCDKFSTNHFRVPQVLYVMQNQKYLFKEFWIRNYQTMIFFSFANKIN